MHNNADSRAAYTSFSPSLLATSQTGKKTSTDVCKMLERGSEEKLLKR